MAQSTALFVGLDVHKDSIAVAHAAGSTAPPVIVGAPIGLSLIHAAVRKASKRLNPPSSWFQLAKMRLTSLCPDDLSGFTGQRQRQSSRAWICCRWAEPGTVAEGPNEKEVVSRA